MIKRRNPHKLKRKGQKICFDQVKIELSDKLRQMGYNAKVATVAHLKKDGVGYVISLHHPFARLERISLEMAKHEKVANGSIMLFYRCDFTPEEYNDFWQRHGEKIFEYEKACRNRRALRRWQKA